MVMKVLNERACLYADSKDGHLVVVEAIHTADEAESMMEKKGKVAHVLVKGDTEDCVKEKVSHENCSPAIMTICSEAT